MAEKPQVASALGALEPSGGEVTLTTAASSRCTKVRVHGPGSLKCTLDHGSRALNKLANNLALHLDRYDFISET